MKVLDSLSNAVKSRTKVRLSEVNQKIIDQLVGKFKTQTTDGDDVILKYIEAFGRYKNGLPPEQRDIFKYSYDELKTLIDAKSSGKTIKNIFNYFKKTTEGVDKTQLSLVIKKYLEVRPFLPKEFQNIKNIGYYDLVEMLEKDYEDLIRRNAPQYFQKKTPNLDNTIVKFYIDSYLRIVDDIDVNSKILTSMSFTELEHLVDSYNSKHGVSKEESRKVWDEELNLVYDKNNLKIYLSESKNACIQLAKGRSWCISRKGSGNMYYNYRFDKSLTIYFVINEDLPYDDLDYALVILVDRDGDIRIADRGNSTYGGGHIVSWDTAYSKCPKLKGLEHIFKPKPLTPEEEELFSKYKNVRIQSDPIKELGSEEAAEIWLEINSPSLGDNDNPSSWGNIVYSNLTDSLRKKYIALGFNLTYNQIKMSSDDIINYYISNRMSNILSNNKSLKTIDQSDYDVLRYLINTTNEKSVINKLIQIKKELISRLSSSDFSGSVSNQLKLNDNSLPARVVNLFGFDKFVDIYSNYGKSVNKISYEPSDKIPVELTDKFIESFPNLETLAINNVKTLSDSISELRNLRYLLLKDSTIDSLPKSIVNIPNLQILNLTGNDRLIKNSKWLSDYYEEIENGMFTPKFD